jgi:hypothetical protein
MKEHRKPAKQFDEDRDRGRQVDSCGKGKEDDGGGRSQGRRRRQSCNVEEG